VGLPSTGRASCPSRQIPEGSGLTAAFRASSNPGIRRPRWGGVAVGVAVSATPTRIEKKGRIDLVMELIGIGVTDALLSGY
jgi:hypothetical protein